MRKAVLIAVLVLSAIAVFAAAADGLGSPAVTVEPGRGGPRTRFAVRFRAPERAGIQGVMDRRYVVDASGRSGPRGCLAATSVSVTQAAAPARVRVTLSPRPGHAWCKGTFHGQIEEMEAPVCSAGVLCPLFVVFVRQIGKFTFRVH